MYLVCWIFCTTLSRELTPFPTHIYLYLQGKYTILCCSRFYVTKDICHCNKLNSLYKISQSFVFNLKKEMLLTCCSSAVTSLTWKNDVSHLMESLKLVSGFALTKGHTFWHLFYRRMFILLVYFRLYLLNCLP